MLHIQIFIKFQATLIRFASTATYYLVLNSVRCQDTIQIQIRVDAAPVLCTKQRHVDLISCCLAGSAGRTKKGRKEGGTVFDNKFEGDRNLGHLS
jgi:hypothetical protein